MQLLEKRTAALDALAQPTKLFEDAAKPAKKRKVQCIDPIMLDLEGYGTLVVQPASKKTQDLHIAFTADNVKAFCQWMLPRVVKELLVLPGGPTKHLESIRLQPKRLHE